MNGIDIARQLRKWGAKSGIVFFSASRKHALDAFGVNALQYLVKPVKYTDLSNAMDIVLEHKKDQESAISIIPDGEYVVYAKVTDNDGNGTIVNSQGIVVDATAPALAGLTNGETYYGHKIFKVVDDYLSKLEVDGIDVTAQISGDDKAKTITFESDSFSTYGLMYVDTTNPKTGDSSLYLWISLLFVSGVRLFGTLILKKREKAKAN